MVVATVLLHLFPCSAHFLEARFRLRPNFRRVNTSGILSRFRPGSFAYVLHRLPVRAALIHSYELTGPRKLYATSGASAAIKHDCAAQRVIRSSSRAQWIRVMPEDVDRIRPRAELREWPKARAASSLSIARQIDINRGITRRRPAAARLAVSKLFLDRVVNWSPLRGECAKFPNLHNVQRNTVIYFAVARKTR